MTIAHVEPTGYACSCPGCQGLTDSDTGSGGDPQSASAKPEWTVEQVVEHLTRSGYSWSGDTVTYSFTTSNPGYGTEQTGWSAFNAAQQATAREAIGLWDDLIAISFTEASDQAGAIRFSNTTTGPTQAWAYYPSWSSVGGDVWINPNQFSNLQLDHGQYGLLTLVHEIGHAIGLPHPGAYNYTPGQSITYNTHAEYLQDTREYTVMSYFNSYHTGADHYNGGFKYASTPLLHDIAAIQSVYGADYTTRAGDTVYGFNTTADRDAFDFTVNTNPVVAIWDGGGTDTLDLSGYSSASRIDLNAGAFSDVNGMTDNVAIAYGAVIENAIGGSGNDTISGNAAGNWLYGRDGADTLDGAAGADLLFGGDGNDFLKGGAGNDLFDGGNGNDFVFFDGARDDFALRGFLQGSTWFVEFRDLTGAEGTDFGVAIEGAQFAGAVYGFKGIQQNAVSNVDGGAFNDVLFQNTTTGQIAFVDMGGSGAGAFTNMLGAMGSGWTVRTSGDLSGDGRAEALVQNTNSGSIFTYEIGAGWTAIATNLTADWTLKDLGDFTGDGVLDLLIQNAAGSMLYLDVDAGGGNSGYGTVANIGTAWGLVGVGDFDRDGVSDVAIQHKTNGMTYYANMDGGSKAGWGLVAGGVGPDWKAKGVADVNGDGYDDVVFRNNATGQIWGVDMLGGSNSGWFVIDDDIGTGWDVASALDHDNDGYDDVLIRNSADGTTLAADMNAGTFTEWDTVTGVMGNDWVLV